MVISPRSSHAPWADMVRHNVAIVGEPFLAESADAILRRNLCVYQLPHLGVRADLPEPSWVLRIIDPSNSQLVRSFSLRDGLTATARQ